jgi:hypothetical protein
VPSECCRNANHSQDVGTDFIDQSFLVDAPGRTRFYSVLNSCVVEHTVKRGEIGHNFLRHSSNRGVIPNIERDMTHARIRTADFPETILPPPGDDDLIPQLVKRLSQTSTDPGGSAGDENRVGSQPH